MRVPSCCGGTPLKGLAATAFAGGGGIAAGVTVCRTKLDAEPEGGGGKEACELGRPATDCCC